MVAVASTNAFQALRRQTPRLTQGVRQSRSEETQQLPTPGLERAEQRFRLNNFDVFTDFSSTAQRDSSS